MSFIVYLMYITVIKLSMPLMMVFALMHGHKSNTLVKCVANWLRTRLSWGIPLRQCWVNWLMGSGSVPQ